MYNRSGHRWGTFHADPRDRAYVYPHYHGTGGRPKKWLSYDGMERFAHPPGRPMAGRGFDVPGNPFQPFMSRALANGLDVGKPAHRVQRLTLEIPGTNSYGDSWNGIRRPSEYDFSH